MDEALGGSGESEFVTWNPVERNWHLRAPWRTDLSPADATVAACGFCPGGSEELVSEGPHFVNSKFPFVEPPVDGAYAPQRVLFFSRDHERGLGDLSVDELTGVLDTLRVAASRMLRHAAVRSVYVFQASSSNFGGSVSHPHVQVLGLPFVPTKLVPDGRGGCPICKDFGGAECVIAETGNAVLAVPPWSRVPYEMVISPRAHVQSLDQCDTEHLAILLRRGLEAVAGVASTSPPAYVLNVMTAPRVSSDPSDGLDLDHHLRIELMPYYTPAGEIRRTLAIESGLGVVLNTVLPADAARRLRGLIDVPSVRSSR